MNCKDFERLIPLYLKNELEDKGLKVFIEHVTNCNPCKEELAIQFLITEGMQRLEDGDTLDVERELNDKLIQSIKRLERKRRFSTFFILSEIAITLGLIVVLLYFLVL